MIEKCFKKLDRIMMYKNWNVEKPNIDSVTNSKKVLNFTKSINFYPTDIIPLDGGINLMFIYKNKCGEIRCYNDGKSEIDFPNNKIEKGINRRQLKQLKNMVLG